jgi:uncharacterized integral membrane protein
MTAIAYRPAPAPRLRLTRRGRAVAIALVASGLVLAAVIFGLGAGGAVATRQAGTANFEYVTVGAGQSLWDLAADVAPEADAREFAAQVASLNNLDGSTIQPGQRLAIPAQYSD